MENKDPKNMTDEELEASLTADVVKDATTADVNADAPAKGEQNKDPEPKKVEDPNKDPDNTKGKDDGQDPNKDPDNKEKKETPSSIKNLLSKKNDEKRQKEEALKIVSEKDKKIKELEETIKKLKNPTDDDTMTDEERAEKLQTAITKKTLAEDQKEEALSKANSIDVTDENARTEEIGKYFTDNPELIADKEDIMELAKAYPTLPMDQVHKLRLAHSDPLQLISQEEKNKLKGGFNMAGKFDRSGAKGKDPKDMTDAELEQSLNDAFKGGDKIL